MNNADIAVDWVVAAVAPWTVSPHPNFSEASPSNAALLALVTERRDHDLDRHLDKTEEPFIGWPSELVRNARLSLYAETQLQAAQDLWDLAFRPEVPVGARAAAALYGSVALNENEQSDLAVVRLVNLVDELTAASEPSSQGASFRLAIAVLLQQTTLRQLDCGLDESAFQTTESVLDWVPRQPLRAFDQFAVSRGIKWSSARVQSDVAESTRGHALATRAFSDIRQSSDLWVDVIRGRSGWIDARMNLRAAQRDAAVLRDVFESKLESTSGKQVFMRTTAVEHGVDALLISELSGDSGRARSNREALAKILLVEHAGSSFYTKEAIRLLRHARATSTLQSALNRVRAEGPDYAMKQSAELILRRSPNISTSEQDLMVLDYSADYLSSDELQSAIEVTWQVLGSDEGMSTGWSTLDKAWKTTARLVPGSNYDEPVAERAAKVFEYPEVISAPFTNSLAQLVQSIDWNSVGEDAKHIWTDFATNQLEAGEENGSLDKAMLSRLIRDAIGNDDKGATSDATGIQLAAQLADEGLPLVGDSDQILKSSATDLIAALEDEAGRAAKGTYSFGGPDTCNVAVAFAARFSFKPVWNAVADYLTNPLIDGVLKGKALDRIAQFPKDVPAYVSDALSHGWHSIIDTPRTHNFFSRPSTATFPEAIRAGASLRILSQSTVVEAILALIAEDEPGKVEAAKTIPLAVYAENATWAHALLLQLSLEENPDIRVEAGRGLVATVSESSLVQPSVVRRIGELLDSDGIRIPLRILHALQNESASTYAELTDLLPKVYQLSSNSAPRVIRGAAKEAIRAWTSREPNHN